jgi:hypothetical protein
VGRRYPESLLSDTLWSFHGQRPYASLPAFVAAVRQHHISIQDYAPDIEPDESWQPDEMALRSPRAIIRYFWDVGPEQVWAETEIAADGMAFSSGELFYKLHNAVVDRLCNSGHCEFEGLEYEGNADSGVPIYEMVLGS